MWFRTPTSSPAGCQVSSLTTSQSVWEASLWIGLAAVPWLISPAELEETAADTSGTIVMAGVSWACYAWLVPCAGD